MRRGTPTSIRARARTRARPARNSPIRTTISPSTGSTARDGDPEARSVATRTRAGRPRILLINGSSRTRAHLPGRDVEELTGWSRSRREIFAAEAGVEIEMLDLSRLASEYGRNIHPCKACFSTAAALCHWPCSCYPNYSLGQTQDWMNDIYPMWVAAHGIMIVTPVNWYQVDLAAEADDGPAGLRRRRQSRPDPHARQGREEGQGDRARRAGTIRAISPGGSSPSSCMATSRARRTCAARSPTGCASWSLAPGGTGRRARPLHRLLEALCHQPRGARRATRRCRRRCATPRARCSKA